MEMINPIADAFLRNGLVYLREVVRTLGSQGLQLASDWGDDVEAEDQDSWAGIYIRPARARTDYLWMGIAADPDESPKVWLACVGGPETLWERLKKSVPGEVVEEVFVLEDEEAGDVDDGLFCGIELKFDLAPDAAVSALREAAHVAGLGIAKALAPARKPAAKKAAAPKKPAKK